jgi:DNA mismatch repair protein MutS2
VAEQELRLKGERAASQRQQKEALEKAWQEARDIVLRAKRDVNAILDEARREKGRSAKKLLEDAERQVEEKLTAFHPEELLTADRLAEGMVVFVRSIGYDAIITAVDQRHGRLRVRAGRMELEIPLTDASPARRKAAVPNKASRLDETEVTLSRELKIIGMRVDEALPELESFLNHASMEGIGEVRIIHGKGTGALMRAVRDYLDGHPLVAEFRKGESFEGGDGATVVTLR